VLVLVLVLGPCSKGTLHTRKKEDAMHQALFDPEDTSPLSSDPPSLMERRKSANLASAEMSTAPLAASLVKCTTCGEAMSKAGLAKHLMAGTSLCAGAEVNTTVSKKRSMDADSAVVEDTSMRPFEPASLAQPPLAMQTAAVAPSTTVNRAQ
jgi:hypothetical protein